MSLATKMRFLGRYVHEPDVVGAVAPSSRALAEALCEPFRRRSQPADVLEVGAGTGPVTRCISRLLGQRDSLDVCEVQNEFAEILKREVFASPALAPAVAAGRVRLLHMPVQKIPPDTRYDFVISGLPLTAFELEDVRSVLATIRRSLRPGGVFSYFEYVGLRRVSRTLSIGRKRTRIRRVSACLSETIRNHQFERATILRNFPPAHARHLRFNPAASLPSERFTVDQ